MLASAIIEVAPSDSSLAAWWYEVSQRVGGDASAQLPLAILSDRVADPIVAACHRRLRSHGYAVSKVWAHPVVQSRPQSGAAFWEVTYRHETAGDALPVIVPLESSLQTVQRRRRLQHVLESRVQIGRAHV